jgi:hypothetical protein
MWSEKFDHLARTSRRTVKGREGSGRCLSAFGWPA